MRRFAPLVRCAGAVRGVSSNQPSPRGTIAYRNPATRSDARRFGKEVWTRPHRATRSLEDAGGGRHDGTVAGDQEVRFAYGQKGIDVGPDRRSWAHVVPLLEALVPAALQDPRAVAARAVPPCPETPRSSDLGVRRRQLQLELHAHAELLQEGMPGTGPALLARLLALHRRLGAQVPTEVEALQTPAAARQRELLLATAVRLETAVAVAAAEARAMEDPRTQRRAVACLCDDVEHAAAYIAEQGAFDGAGHAVGRLLEVLQVERRASAAEASAMRRERRGLPALPEAHQLT